MNHRRLQKGLEGCFRAQGSDDNTPTKVIQIQGVPDDNLKTQKNPEKPTGFFLTQVVFLGYILILILILILRMRIRMRLTLRMRIRITFISRMIE